MYNDFECSPTLLSCLFAENSAVMAGGMGNDGNSNPVLVNCTVARNEAEEVGAGIYQGTGPSNNPVIINSILWGNICDNDEANIANWHQCGPEVRFSCVEGGYAGLAVIECFNQAFYFSVHSHNAQFNPAVPEAKAQRNHSVTLQCSRPPGQFHSGQLLSHKP